MRPIFVILSIFTFISACKNDKPAKIDNALVAESNVRGNVTNLETLAVINNCQTLLSAEQIKTICGVATVELSTASNEIEGKICNRSAKINAQSKEEVQYNVTSHASLAAAKSFFNAKSKLFATQNQVANLGESAFSASNGNDLNLVVQKGKFIVEMKYSNPEKPNAAACLCCANEKLTLLYKELEKGI